MTVSKIFKCAFSIPLLVGSWVCVPAHATDNCEAIRASIEANIASKGVTGFAVYVVDVAAAVRGEVVGRCGNGTKKIVYDRSAGSLPAAKTGQSGAIAPRPVKKSEPSSALTVPKASGSQDILTECKDGSVSMNGVCKH